MLRQNCGICADDISMHIVEWTFRILIQFSPRFLGVSLTISQCWFGKWLGVANPLSESMVAQFTDTYKCHPIWMNYKNILRNSLKFCMIMLSQKYMKPGSCDNLQILFKKTRFITYSPIYCQNVDDDIHCIEANIWVIALRHKSYKMWRFGWWCITFTWPDVGNLLILLATHFGRIVTKIQTYKLTKMHFHVFRAICIKVNSVSNLQSHRNT